MACRERGCSKLVLCLGVFLVASSLCYCTRFTKLKTLDKLRRNWTFSHDQAKGSELRYGILLVGRNSLQDAKLDGPKATKNFLDIDADYQADMDWGQSKQPKGLGDGSSKWKPDGAPVERLLKLEPKVECTADSMKLEVENAASTPVSLFFVDRGSSLSPLPLSKLPPSCGYSIRSTRRELVLVAPYDGCFVALEEDSYVLPLRWLGLPVRMSCPLMRQSSSNPPMVTCHAEGMVVRTEWTISVAKIRINLNGNWQPLMKTSSRCGFSVVVHPEGVVIAVHYAPCLEKKDGMYTLELAGDEETKISCPSLSTAQTTQQPQIQETPFYPYPFYVKPVNPDGVPPAPRPELKPSPTAPTFVKTTKDQRQQLFYPFPIYPQPSSSEAPTTKPLVTKPPPCKLEYFPPNQFNHLSQPSEEPIEQSVGQEHKPLYPLPFYTWPPQPAASEPPHVDPPYQFYPEQQLPEQPEPPKPTVSEEPHGQIYQPFFPYPYLPHGPYETPEPPTHQTPTPASNGQEQQPVNPLQEEMPKPETTDNLSPGHPSPVPASKDPTQPEAPLGQVYQPFYHWPQPEKYTADPEPPQPEAPQSQVFQPFYPSHYFGEPDNQQATKPTAVPKPPEPAQPEAPLSQVYQPIYPYHFYLQPEPENEPAEKPIAAASQTPQPESPQGQPPAVKLPGGQGPQPFNPYYYYPQQSQHLQPVTLPPTTTLQQPQQVIIPAGSQNTPESAISQPSNGVVPQGSSYVPPVYCPQFCPSGFSNCCPQIAFHQHLHHIVPSVPGKKDTLPVYPGLPFLPSLAYSGFSSGLGATPLPQNPITSTSAPKSPPEGKENQQHIQPPDGNPAALPGSNPTKSLNPEQQNYPYFGPYSNWPLQTQNEELQNLPQWQSPAHYSKPSKAHSQGYKPENPVAQDIAYNGELPKQQNGQPTWDMSNPSGLNHMSFIRQKLHTLKQQNKLTPKELQPYDTQSSESRGLTHPEAHGELYRLPFPDYMLQDAQAPTYKSVASNISTQQQPFVSGSKYDRWEHAVNDQTDPKHYVLLQHGPPGRERNSFRTSPLHFLVQNQASHQTGKRQHGQNRLQRPKWLGKGMSNPLPGGVNYMPKPGDQTESFHHFVPLAQDPSLSGTYLKPKSFDSSRNFWKPITPLGSQSHVSGNSFQQPSSAFDKEMD